MLDQLSKGFLECAHLKRLVETHPWFKGAAWLNERV
jgi:hypothetical protein